MSSRSVQRLQSAYSVPAMTKEFLKQQADIISSLKETSNIVMGGDARCDSPGYSAKYGSYSLMDLKTSKIIDLQLVQSNEVKSSTHMELEGLKRCLAYLFEQNIQIQDLVTDRHVMVKAYMKREQHHVKHYFDVWHIAKGISKKLHNAVNKRDAEEIRQWIQGIVNHCYWVASSRQLKRDKWMSISKHMINQHIHDSDLFAKCEHDDLGNEDRVWMKEDMRDGSSKSTPLSVFITDVDMKGKIITSLELFKLDNKDRVKMFKIMPRSQNTYAYVNACFRVKFDAMKYHVLSKPSILFGGISATLMHATKTEAFLVGKCLTDAVTLKRSLEILKSEINPTKEEVLASPEYRRDLSVNLFYKFVLELCGKELKNRGVDSGSTELMRPLSSGKQSYDKVNKEEWPLKEAMPKVTSHFQASGEAQFVSDIPHYNHELAAALVLTSLGPATINKIDSSLALTLPGVVFISLKDIPDKGVNTFINRLHFDMAPEEIFCSGDVRFAGQVVGLILAETQSQADAEKVEITYINVQRPVLTVADAIEADSFYDLPVPPIIVGHPEEAFKKAARTVTGECSMESLYHFYLENNVCVCVPVEDGMRVHASTQWPDQLQSCVNLAIGKPFNYVEVLVPRLGGGFGGKCNGIANVTAAVAIAAYKTERPVRCNVNLNTNMQFNGLRFPLFAKYKAGFDESGKIDVIEVESFLNCGHSTCFAFAVIDNIQDQLDNGYSVANWFIHSKAAKTHTPSGQAMRAPGSKCYKMLNAVIGSQYLLRDIPKLSPEHQTYGLEVFHSVVNKFAPILQGIGHATSKKLSTLGIHSLGDLQNSPVDSLIQELGETMTTKIKQLACGIDNSPVVPFGLPQTLSDEDSFRTCNSLTAVKQKITELLQSLLNRLLTDGRIPHTLRLTVRRGDWRQYGGRESRQCSISSSLFTRFNIECMNQVLTGLTEIAVSLFHKLVNVKQPFNILLMNIAFTKMEPRVKNAIQSFFHVQTHVKPQNILLHLDDDCNESVSRNHSGDGDYQNESVSGNYSDNGHYQNESFSRNYGKDGYHQNESVFRNHGNDGRHQNESVSRNHSDDCNHQNENVSGNHSDDGNHQNENVSGNHSNDGNHQNENVTSNHTDDILYKNKSIAKTILDPNSNNCLNLTNTLIPDTTSPLMTSVPSNAFCSVMEDSCVFLKLPHIPKQLSDSKGANFSGIKRKIQSSTNMDSFFAKKQRRFVNDASSKFVNSTSTSSNLNNESYNQSQSAFSSKTAVVLPPGVESDVFFQLPKEMQQEIMKNFFIESHENNREDLLKLSYKCDSIINQSTELSPSSDTQLDIRKKTHQHSPIKPYENKDLNVKSELSPSNVGDTQLDIRKKTHQLLNPTRPYENKDLNVKSTGVVNFKCVVSEIEHQHVSNRPQANQPSKETVCSKNLVEQGVESGSEKVKRLDSDFRNSAEEKKLTESSAREHIDEKRHCHQFLPGFQSNYTNISSDIQCGSNSTNISSSNQCGSNSTNVSSYNQCGSNSTNVSSYNQCGSNSTNVSSYNQCGSNSVHSKCVIPQDVDCEVFTSLPLSLQKELCLEWEMKSMRTSPKAGSGSKPIPKLKNKPKNTLFRFFKPSNKK